MEGKEGGKKGRKKERGGEGREGENVSSGELYKKIRDSETSSAINVACSILSYALCFFVALQK